MSGSPAWKIGTAWTTRITNDKDGTTRDVRRSFVEVRYKNAVFSGIASEGYISIYDTDHNPVARLKDEKLIEEYDPSSGLLSWPLSVGKQWEPKFNYMNLRTGTTWNSVQPRNVVEAYEDVTVPAGTFKAFRIKRLPGVQISDTRTYWYSPELGLTVKVIVRGGYYVGSEDFTEELLLRPQ